MLLSGTYEQSIDGKNRLSIPYQVRGKLNDERDGKALYVVLGRRQGTLDLWPEKTYETKLAGLPPDDELSDEAYAWRQFESAQRALVTPDDQGRIGLPARLLKTAGIGSDVVLIAVHDHLELWSRPAFEAFEASMLPEYPRRRAEALQEMKALAAQRAGTEAGGARASAQPG